MIDIGPAVLAALFDALAVDDAWSIRSERSFWWVAHRLRQSFEVSPMFEDLDFALCQLTVRTTVLRGVELDASDVASVLAELNAKAVGSAFCYDDGAGEVFALLAVGIHDEVRPDRIREVSLYSILQLIEAERKGDTLADLLGGELATVAHPLSGFRDMPDDMLTADTLLVDAPAGPSRFHDSAELLAVTEFARGTGGRLFSTGASRDSVALEAPFGPDDTALIELVPTERHPWLRNGLLVLTRFRGSADFDEVVIEANDLNAIALSSSAPFPSIGAWTVWPNGNQFGLAFNAFVPDILFRPRAALAEAMRAAYRAALFDAFRYPGLPQRSAADVYNRRLARSEGDWANIVREPLPPS